MSALKLFCHNHGVSGDQSLLKTVTFAITHFSVAFSVAYLLTGDIILGSLIAMIEPAINTVAYFFHEKLWAKHQKANKPLSARIKTPSNLPQGSAA